MKQHNYKIAIVNCQLSIILMALLFALPLKAQVNIGSLDSPHPFSILELTTTENNHGGLRMPQLDNDERAAAQEKFNETTATAEAAKGLVIYNTDTGCLEFWNGKEWISLCSDILPPLPPTLDVDLGSMTFSSNGNVTSSAMNIVTVTTNQANWTATITYKQGDEWLTGVPASGTNGQQFTVTVPGGATTLRTAIITITAGDLTRYVAVAQFPDNYQDSPVPASIIPYVGAFWKHNQTGERLIWIPRPTTGNVDVADGAWTAAVISGSDWITLDKQMTSDPNVGWLTGADEANVDNGNDNGFDNKHAVANGSNMVTGTMDASIPQIYFRIGLKSALASDETAPRYGIVLLTYNDNTLSQRIFIRQGEAADYLFRGDDPVGSGSNISLRTAIQCKQYLPYNLTDPNGNSSDALLTSGVPDVGLAPYGGVPVDYPSQAGYFFRWNYSRQAFAPQIVGTITNWDNTLLQSGDGNWVVSTNNETCPPGYRRPNDGTQNNTLGPAVISEMRQSLYLNPKNGSGGTYGLENTVQGYYADGFFDRRQITSGPAGSNNPGVNSSVSTGNNQIAHRGCLYYNPYNNASLFFPAAGSRGYNTGGALSDAGENGNYWSSSTSLSPYNSWSQNFIRSDGSANQNSSYRTYGFSIRCIKDN